MPSPTASPSPQIARVLVEPVLVGNVPESGTARQRVAQEPELPASLLVQRGRRVRAVPLVLPIGGAHTRALHKVADGGVHVRVRLQRGRRLHAVDGQLPARRRRQRTRTGHAVEIARILVEPVLVRNVPVARAAR